MLNVMLEKGKGSILGKLHTIQLIEADLQLVMRIFIKYRNQNKLEINDRMSKFNYGSRREYSIEDTLLEKHLIYDSSIITMKKPLMLLLT